LIEVERQRARLFLQALKDNRRRVGIGNAPNAHRSVSTSTDEPAHIRTKEQRFDDSGRLGQGILAGQDRAIVTDLPGTTRDLIHADLSLDGLPVQIVDTAGLRTTVERVEQEGVRRAQQQAAGADVVLLLEEDGIEPGHEDATLAQTRMAVDPDRLVRVRNKIDLTGSTPGRFDDGGTTILHVSALTGAGIEALARAIKERAGFAGEGTTFTARRRHITALQAAQGALLRASDLTAVAAAPPELIAEELRAVHQALGSIVGLVSADELLGEIFASFCIGK
jgi:tRNA modification GTPase